MIVWTTFVWLIIGSSGRSYEHIRSNEPLGFIKDEYLEQLSDYQLIKKTLRREV
jgi:hypothetical protein